MKKLISSAVIILFVTLFSVGAQAFPGDLYVQVDLDGVTSNCSILRVTPGGGLSQFISSLKIKSVTGQGSADCGDTGLAIDRDQNVYFSEDVSDAVLVATPEGDLSIFVTEAQITALTGSGSADIDNGMTVGLDGNLYFADEQSDFVLKATIPDGVVSVVLTEDEIAAVTGKTGGADLEGGIVFDCMNNLYMTDVQSQMVGVSNDLILKLTPGGNLSIFLNEAQIEAVTGETSTDLDVGVNFLDSLYVLDDGGCDCVLKINTNGDIEIFVSEQEIEDVTGGGADLEGGIAVTQSRDLFIGDDGSPDSPNILGVTQTGPVVSIFVSTAQLQAFYPGFTPRLVGSMAVSGVDSCAFLADIPTLSEWGLMVMALALGIIGFVVIRKRTAKA
jgi:exosortase sorting signal-containing protein